MNLDLSKFKELDKKNFIKNGQKFELCVSFEKGDTNISILSYVEFQDEIYKLHVKGNYPKGSTAIISIGNKNSTLERMYAIAIVSMKEYIPIMVTEDYPESLKKIAKNIK